MSKRKTRIKRSQKTDETRETSKYAKKVKTDSQLYGSSALRNITKRIKTEMGLSK